MNSGSFERLVGDERLQVVVEVLSGIVRRVAAVDSEATLLGDDVECAGLDLDHRDCEADLTEEGVAWEPRD